MASSTKRFAPACISAILLLIIALIWVVANISLVLSHYETGTGMLGALAIGFGMFIILPISIIFEIIALLQKHQSKINGIFSVVVMAILTIISGFLLEFCYRDLSWKDNTAIFWGLLLVCIICLIWAIMKLLKTLGKTIPL